MLNTYYFLLNTYYLLLTTKNLQRGFIKLTRKALVTYLIAFLVLSGTGIGFMFFKPKKAEAAWADDNWGYRTSYSNNNTGANETGVFRNV